MGYDASQVVITFEGKVITGFVEDSEIICNPFKIEIDEDTSNITDVILNGVRFSKDSSQ